MNRPRNRKRAPAVMEGQHQRLKRLYEISKRLTRFESIARTLPEVLALISESVPVRTAILILEEQGDQGGSRTRAITWHAEGLSTERLRAAQAQASATYSYLARKASHLEEEAGTVRLPASSTPPLEPEQSGFLLLPLVVDQGPVFGALQIEAPTGLDEMDLMFINAMVGQLAIALDRIAVIEAKQAADKAVLAAAQFLSDTSVTLFSSLEYEATIASVVRAAVPPLADISFIDEVREDGRIERIVVATADAGGQDLADQLRHFALASDPQTPQAEVLRTGKSVLHEDFQIFAHDLTRPPRLEDHGVPALMTVPLSARGRQLGVLTFVRGKSGHRYSQTDLALAEEIGRRAAIAMDNARLYEKAQRANEARENLLAMVSHDLRNPLTAIVMNSSSLLRMPDSEDRRADRRKVETIQRSAERMNRLISDLLDMAVIEAGHLTVDAKSHSITSIVEEAVESQRATATSKAQQLGRKIPSTPAAVNCDRDRTLQVFGNLIDNAIKFTPEGGSVNVGVEQRGDQVLFSIADTGSGIPADMLSHVFDRFWQAKKTARQGSGLGLSIAKALVESQGGKLWVESEIGVGSTFFFTLPKSDEVAESRSAVRDAPQDGGPKRSSPVPSARLTILVVDDEADIRESLGPILENEGYHTVLAGNAAEALDYLHAAQAPSLILLDLMMPVMDGWQFLAERNGDPALKRIPVIVISAQPDVEAKVIRANAGYLQKPVPMDRLIETIEHFVH
ncbi:MAG TPA: ATP-binding protein [Polyangiaceae bacterium]|nr:ATP-binding protein [Polyangiaceae bacterium]